MTSDSLNERSGWQLRITGKASVEPCKSRTKRPSWHILYEKLGPTGAGKSTFIEALSGEDQSLGISKDQLAGFTQEITAYELKNVEVIGGYSDSSMPIYLIDTPGFSDSKISELEIVKKIQRWMSDEFFSGNNSVFYFCPATDTRVAGSKHRTIKMIQSLVLPFGWHKCSIVTTMWDRVSNPQAKERAEANFAQLRDNIWEDAVIEGALMSKFENNYESALRIIWDVVQSRGVYTPLGNEKVNRTSPEAPFLYQELLDRISNARREKEHLLQEKVHLITQPDPLLELVVLPRLQEVKQDLEKFVKQLVGFGTPPPNFEGALELCVHQELLDHVIETQEEWAALNNALARLRTSPDRAREGALKAQLDLVEYEFTQCMARFIRLMEGGALHVGNEKALEDILNSSMPSEQAGRVLSSLTPTMHITSAGQPEDSLDIPSGATLKGRFKRVLQSFKDKLSARFQRENHH